jgi:hypothetical protein
MNHTRKSSLGNSSIMYRENEERSESRYRDTIRTYALDRSYRKVGKQSRSPLKMRPNF